MSSASPSFNPVVLAPTFNNAGTVVDILRRLDALGDPIIVVNDGSTDDTATLLTQWLSEPRQHAAIVETHPHNRGKAAGLMTGFDKAKRLGYTHVLTIDTDGQLDPAQTPQLLRLAEQNPDAIILGTRDETAPDYPTKSRVGRRVANLLVWMESGLRISDSQCGLRVYPLVMEDLFRCRARRYGFETEVLVRAGWAGWPVVETPVRCVYFSGDERVSHFRPWRDSIRAAGMHFRLVGRTLFPFGRSNSRRPRQEPTGTWDERLPLGRRILHWLSPREAWRQLKLDGPDGYRRTAMAGGLAIGAFIGCVPVYGLHAFIGLYAARRLNLNPLGVLLGTQISFPPLGIFLAVAATAIGSLLLQGSLPPLSAFEPLWKNWNGIFQVGPWFIADWFLGSLVVGAICMVIVFFFSDWFLKRLLVGKAEDGPAAA